MRTEEEMSTNQNALKDIFQDYNIVYGVTTTNIIVDKIFIWRCCNE